MTGCLKAPYFQYGFTDEKEFASEIATSKVPATMVDTGTIVQIARTYIGGQHSLNTKTQLLIYIILSMGDLGNQIDGLLTTMFHSVRHVHSTYQTSTNTLIIGRME